MTNEHEQFVDLATYALVRTAPKAIHGTLIKARDIACTGTHTVEVGETSGQPTIITHRDGDVIKAIEVICVCGASLAISLEY